MSRLDYCQYELVDDCYDWKNDNCDECNIFKAYCEGARRAKNSIVRCKDCIYWLQHEQFGFDEDNDEYHDYCALLVPDDDYYAYTRKADDFCSYGERREE